VLACSIACRRNIYIFTWHDPTQSFWPAQHIITLIMDHESLRTAGTYLNNLLLARGLLRNVEPIDFVKPSKESRAQIINLVHDLILREDRAKDERERIAGTVRNLRSENTAKTQQIERLVAKAEEHSRTAVQAEAGERNAQTELKKVEKAMKALQDQTAKLKTTLAQVKTQCTNDVRKRDLELGRLKTHLQGQQRGNKVGMAAPTMHIRQPGDKRSNGDVAARDVRDAEYSLKQETTEFLTQLSQSLSDENDGLINIVRHSLETLKDLLGISLQSEQHPDSAIGSLGSEQGAGMAVKGKSNTTVIHALPASYETLASDMDTTLAHLKTLLTNPNFVSVEEVEVREEEIGRLRRGWERMEQRWKDVLVMMEGWRKRMDTGETINMEDLRKGMGLVSPDRDRHDALLPVQELSFVDSELSDIQIPDVSEISESSLVAPAPPIHKQPLVNHPKRKRDVLEPPESFNLRPTSRSRSEKISSRSVEAGPIAPTFEEDDGEESEELEVPQLTIEEKLHVAQAEAEKAVREKKSSTSTSARESKIARSTRTITDTGSGRHDEKASDKEAGADDALGKNKPSTGAISPMAKRTKIRGRPRNRKSTLSPEELAALIGADDA
jgi:hypothetical protein